MSGSQSSVTLFGAKAEPFPGLKELPAPGLLKIVPRLGAPLDALLATSAAGFSTDTAAVSMSFTFWVKRICGTRSQLKPGTYCPSIVSGMFSPRATMPCLFAVIRLHV